MKEIMVKYNKTILFFVFLASIASILFTFFTFDNHVIAYNRKTHKITKMKNLEKKGYYVYGGIICKEINMSCEIKKNLVLLKVGNIHIPSTISKFIFKDKNTNIFYVNKNFLFFIFFLFLGILLIVFFLPISKETKSEIYIEKQDKIFTTLLFFITLLIGILPILLVNSYTAKDGLVIKDKNSSSILIVPYYELLNHNDKVLFKKDNKFYLKRITQ